MEVKCVQNIQRSVMCAQWDRACKDSKPVGSSWDFERRHLQHYDVVSPRDHMHSIINREVLLNPLHAEVII